MVGKDGGAEEELRLASDVMALAFSLLRFRLHLPYSCGVASEDFRLGVDDEGFALVLEDAGEGGDDV